MVFYESTTTAGYEDNVTTGRIGLNSFCKHPPCVLIKNLHEFRRKWGKFSS